MIFHLKQKLMIIKNVHRVYNWFIKTFIFLLLFLVSLTPLTANEDIPERPSPPRLVNDFANILSSGEQNSLEQKLVQFNNQTSTQIAVVTVETLKGYDVGDFAFRLGEKWQVGQGGFDNGVVLLLKPRQGNERGRVFIATGYGVEGAIPDAVAKRIVEVEMIPELKQNNYYGAIEKAANTIMELTRGEYTANNYMQKNAGNENSPIGFFIIFIIIMLFSILSSIGRKKRYTMGKRRSNLPFWLLIGMLGSSGSHRGHFGNFSSGGGSFGGGGGGFSGFGGGSFGGGGAGGSW